MWLIYALMAAILWGLNYVLAERVLLSISPITLLALETFAGTIVFSLISYFTTMKKDLSLLSSEPKLLWLTLTEVTVVLIASVLILVSIRLKNATIAGIIELIYPLFTILFVWLLFQENQVSLPVIFGGILIFSGVLVISFV